MHKYIDFIKEYNIGLESGSCWYWRQVSQGHWESKGYACDTIEESLELLKAFIESTKEDNL